IRGTATVHHEDFEGTVTLLVTDAASAWAAVNGEIARWQPAAISAGPQANAAGGAGGAPGTGGATQGAGGAAQPATPDAAATPTSTVAVAGWGAVTFRYKDWLRGSAEVVVDPDGDITSLGKIHVPREFTIFEAKTFASKERTYESPDIPLPFL